MFDRNPGWPGRAGRPTWPLRLLWLLLLVAATTPALAQSGGRSPVDGLTVGAGISAYLGDLDGNPEKNPIHYFAAGRVSLFAAADRRFGEAAAGLEFHLDQFDVNRPRFVMDGRIFSLDLVGGYHFDILRNDFLRLAAGLGASLVVPSYERFPEEDQTTIRTPGTRPLLTFPLSLSFQNRVRFGARLTATDFLDGFKGTGGDRDLIFYLKVGYRFDLDR